MKDLSRLGRELSKVIIVDNSPASYIFHPENAVSSSQEKAPGLRLSSVLLGNHHFCPFQHDARFLGLFLGEIPTLPLSNRMTLPGYFTSLSLGCLI